MPRLLIIDDHPIIRHGLIQMLASEPDLAPLDEAGSAGDAVARFREHRPDAVILDLALGEISGLSVLKLLRDIDHSVPVLVMSMHDESLHAERAFRAGARGYVMKQEATEVVIEALRRVLRGETYLSARMQTRLLTSMLGPHNGAGKTGVERLSDREAEVLRLIGRGRSSADIATQLHRSVKTIEAHRAAIRSKLGVKSAHEMIRVAIQFAESQAETEAATPSSDRA
jgi:DNA-binding NarL/FixJ family response regulator